MNNWYLFIFGLLLVIGGSYFLLTTRKVKKFEKTILEQKLGEDVENETMINLDNVEETKHGFDVSSAFDKFKKKK